MSASIYLITPTTASVTAGGVLPLTSVARRQCGCVTQLGSDSVILQRVGYYKVTATITFTAPATGTVSLRLTQDGQAVPGAIAATSIETATTQVASLAVSAIVRVPYGLGASTLQLVNDGVAITTSNISLDVEYLG